MEVLTCLEEAKDTASLCNVSRTVSSAVSIGGAAAAYSEGKKGHWHSGWATITASQRLWGRQEKPWPENTGHREHPEHPGHSLQLQGGGQIATPVLSIVD